jgi:hypothetical protein
MAQYKVISGMLEGKNVGDIISDAELEGLNIQALIDAEHISTQANKSSKTSDDTKE